MGDFMKSMRAKISKDKDFLILVPGDTPYNHLVEKEKRLLESHSFASVTLGSVVEGGEEKPALFLRLKPRRLQEALKAVPQPTRATG